jgi:hypothetical protein
MMSFNYYDSKGDLAIKKETEAISYNIHVSTTGIDALQVLYNTDAALTEIIQRLQDMQKKINITRVEMGCPVAITEQSNPKVANLLFGKETCSKPNCPGIINCSCKLKGNTPSVHPSHLMTYSDSMRRDEYCAKCGIGDDNDTGLKEPCKINGS